MNSLRRRKVGNYRPPRLWHTYCPCCTQLGARTYPVPDLLLILAYFDKLKLWFCICESLLNVQTFGTTRVKGVNLPFTVGSSPKDIIADDSRSDCFPHLSGRNRNGVASKINYRDSRRSGAFYSLTVNCPCSSAIGHLNNAERWTNDLGTVRYFSLFKGQQ